MPSNEKQFEAVIRPLLGSVYNYARWICGNKEEADDVFQEAMIKVYENLGHLKQNDPRPWIFKILKNTYIDFYRKNARSIQRDFLSQDLERTEVMTPDAEYIRRLDQELLTSLLQKLPKDFQEILVLKELEELSYREIAQVIDQPIGTVMSRLSRAREKLLTLILAQEKGERR